MKAKKLASALLALVMLMTMCASTISADDSFPFTDAAKPTGRMIPQSTLPITV